MATTDPFLLFHGLNAPPTGDTLAGANYGLDGTELTGTLVDPNPVTPIDPPVVQDAFLGFFGGTLPTAANVAPIQFGSNPIQTGTLDAPKTYFSANGATKNMKSFFPTQNMHFDLHYVDANGESMDLPNGIADLSIESMFLIRGGDDPVAMDLTAGVTFSDPGAANDTGNYYLKLDVAAITDAAAVAIVPEVGDKFDIKVKGEFATGEFVETPKYAEIIAPVAEGRPRLF